MIASPTLAVPHVNSWHKVFLELLLLSVSRGLGTNAATVAHPRFSLAAAEFSGEGKGEKQQHSYPELLRCVKAGALAIPCPDQLVRWEFTAHAVLDQEPMLPKAASSDFKAPLVRLIYNFCQFSGTLLQKLIYYSAYQWGLGSIQGWVGRRVGWACTYLLTIPLYPYISRHPSKDPTASQGVTGPLLRITDLNSSFPWLKWHFGFRVLLLNLGPKCQE